jgi:hypothetical protein
VSLFEIIREGYTIIESFLLVIGFSSLVLPIPTLLLAAQAHASGYTFPEELLSFGGSLMRLGMVLFACGFIMGLCKVALFGGVYGTTPASKECILRD